MKILVGMIKNHPEKERIEFLRSLPYGSSEYKELKSGFSYITPHGEFSEKRSNDNLKALSGYLYFDIDAIDIAGDVSLYKKVLIEQYGDKISLLGKSIGGNGVFFYVRVDGGLTPDNFSTIYDYFRTEVFGNLPIDNNAKGIARPQFIPYDEDLYVNNNATVVIPDSILNGKAIKTKKGNSNEGIKQCINDKYKKGYTLNDTLLDIPFNVTPQYQRKLTPQKRV